MPGRLKGFLVEQRDHGPPDHELSESHHLRCPEVPSCSQAWQKSQALRRITKRAGPIQKNVPALREAQIDMILVIAETTVGCRSDHRQQRRVYDRNEAITELPGQWAAAWLQDS